MARFLGRTSEGQHSLTLLTMRVYNLLRLIGVPAAQADSELRQMAECRIGKSRNRRILGSMNEIAATIQYLAEDAPPGELKVSKGELLIAKSIFGYTKYLEPAELTRAILCAGPQCEQ